MREVFVRGPEKGLHGLWRRNGPGDSLPNRSWAGLCDLEQGPAWLVDSGLSDPGIRKVSTSSPSGMGHRESNGS